MNSLGFVEVSGVTAAIDALDIMCKSADVSLVSWERKLGGRLVTLIITGSVSAVQAAVDSAAESCIKRPCAVAVIANPHPETVKLAELSAKRLEKASKPKTQTAKKKTTAKSTTGKNTETTTQVNKEEK